MKRIFIIILSLLALINLESREFVFLQELEHGTVDPDRKMGPLFHDFNRNGKDELIMWTFFGDGADTSNLYFYELEYDYKFSLIKNNKYNGWLWAAGIGDCDNDGLYEILGGDPDSHFIYLMEQTDSFDLPDSITWHSDSIWSSLYPMIITNKLKPDSIDRIAGIGIPGISTAVYGQGFYYYECIGDNSYYMKTFAESTRTSGSFDAGDLNGNGLAEVVFQLIDGSHIVRYEVTDATADSFQFLDSTQLNGTENILILDDTDGDGKKELLKEDINYIGSITSYAFDLYEDDNSDGILDSIWGIDFEVSTNNMLIYGGDIDFGDIDGDGQNEIVICGGTHFEVWKSVSNNTYTKIFEWTNPEYNTTQSHIRCHDFNKNGIDEIIYSGAGTYIGDEGTYIFECRPLAKLGYNKEEDVGNRPSGSLEYDSIYMHSEDELTVVIDSMKLLRGDYISIYNQTYSCSIPAYDSISIKFEIFSDTTVFIRDTLVVYSNDWYGKVDTMFVFGGIEAQIEIDSIVASDNRYVCSGVDYDDYVRIYFNNPIKPPDTSSVDLDDVLALSLGHTWYDGSGKIRQINYFDENRIMTVWFSTNTGNPTVSLGDTVFPDSMTISDDRGYSLLNKPVVITGSFGPSGINSQSEGTVFDLSFKGLNLGNSLLEYKTYTKDTRVDLYDITGRNVLNQKSSQIGSNTISLSSLKSGIYFIRLATPKETINKSIIRMY